VVFELRHSKEQVGFLVGGFDDMALAYVDLVEYGSVEQPSCPVSTTPVGGGAARREPQCEVDDLLPVA